MKPPFQTPTDLILMAVRQTLDEFDWESAGIEGLTIRHARRKFSTPDQFPCLTIRWEEDAPRQSDQDQSWMNADEMGVDMRITLEIELDTSERDGDDGDPAPDNAEDDPTGLGVASAIAGLAMRALRDDEGHLLSLWAMSVSDRGRGEDPESTTDEVRFEQQITVLYRVSSRDPSQILAQGVNL